MIIIILREKNEKLHYSFNINIWLYARHHDLPAIHTASDLSVNSTDMGRYGAGSVYHGWDAVVWAGIRCEEALLRDAFLSGLNRFMVHLIFLFLFSDLNVHNKVHTHTTVWFCFYRHMHIIISDQCPTSHCWCLYMTVWLYLSSIQAEASGGKDS